MPNSERKSDPTRDRLHRQQEKITTTLKYHCKLWYQSLITDRSLDLHSHSIILNFNIFFIIIIHSNFFSFFNIFFYLWLVFTCLFKVIKGKKLRKLKIDRTLEAIFQNILFQTIQKGVDYRIDAICWINVKWLIKFIYMRYFAWSHRNNHKFTLI